MARRSPSKAPAMDVAVVEAGSAQGKDGCAMAPTSFDLTLPAYFAGRPLNHGAARVLIEATVKDSAGHAETRGEPITVSESPADPDRDSGGRHAGSEPGESGLPPGLLSRRDAGRRQPEDPVRRAMPTRARPPTQGGVAVIRMQMATGRRTCRLKVEASDSEGNRASSHSAARTSPGRRPDSAAHGTRRISRRRPHSAESLFHQRRAAPRMSTS